MSAIYLIDGKPHRECDCSANTATCPKGRERTCLTAGFNRCMVPAPDVMMLQATPPEALLPETLAQYKAFAQKLRDGDIFNEPLDFPEMSSQIHMAADTIDALVDAWRSPLGSSLEKKDG